MSRVIKRVVLTAAIVSVTVVASFAQSQTTTSETKSFEVLAVEGNVLVVRLPEGTRELSVPADFRFTVNGQSLTLGQLQPGMKGTATITTRTTMTPVTVTEVKNGTVVQRAAGTIVVRSDNEVKRFSQSDVDKRGIKIVRNGKPAQVTDFREGDRLTATIITSAPPQVLTEREVQATLAANGAAAAPARSSGSPSRAAASPSGGAPSSASATPARTLPKTATSWPLVGLLSLLSIAIAASLTSWRRLLA
jgi:hypothetical protein